MLFLECSPDATLARTLGVPRQEIIHSSGKGKVARNLQKRPGVSGMVDQDPGSAEPEALRQFCEESNHHGVILKVDRERYNRLVILCPRLEEWIIQTARAAQIPMTDFRLSENPGQLHADFNQRLPNFERLLKVLLEQRSARLLHLQSLLTI